MPSPRGIPQQKNNPRPVLCSVKSRQKEALEISGALNIFPMAAISIYQRHLTRQQISIPAECLTSIREFTEHDIGLYKKDSAKNPKKLPGPSPSEARSQKTTNAAGWFSMNDLPNEKLNRVLPVADQVRPASLNTQIEGGGCDVPPRYLNRSSRITRPHKKRIPPGIHHPFARMPYG